MSTQKTKTTNNTGDNLSASEITRSLVRADVKAYGALIEDVRKRGEKDATLVRDLKVARIAYAMSVPELEAEKVLDKRLKLLTDEERRAEQAARKYVSRVFGDAFPKEKAKPSPKTPTAAIGEPTVVNAPQPYVTVARADKADNAAAVLDVIKDVAALLSRVENAHNNVIVGEWGSTVRELCAQARIAAEKAERQFRAAIVASAEANATEAK